MRWRKDERGFGPHPELMIVVLMVGVLSAISIPKFAELIRKSNEGATQGNLGAVRSAMSIWHDDHGGSYPYHPVALTANGKFISALPKAKTPNYHADSDKVTLVPSAAGLDDAGGWAYLADPAYKEYGTLYVNCTHTDTKGSVWSAY